MAAPSVTYTFTSGTTIVHSEVNQNFTDIINSLTDGTADITISTLTANGAVTMNGAVTLGNATSDDITITGRIASDFDPKTAATYNLGDSTQTWLALYLDNGATDGGAVYFNASSTAFLKSDASGADLDVGGFTGLDLKVALIKRLGLYSEAKSGSYTITDTDGVTTILMTTSTSDYTVTLPTAADNAGRVVTVKKADSGSGSCTVDGEGSETINGATTVVLLYQYEAITLFCDGTGWYAQSELLYRSGSTASTFTFNGSGGTSSSVTLKYSRVGDWVHIYIPAFNATTGTSSTNATSDTAIETWARPSSTSQSFRASEIRNASTQQAYDGSWNVTTSGTLQLYRDMVGTAFTNSDSAGLNSPNVFTFYVGSGS